MKYVLIPDSVKDPFQILDFPDELTIDRMYQLLNCETLDFFSFRSFYVACDDSGYGNRPHNLVASTVFERVLFGPVLVGAFYDFRKAAPYADPGFYSLSVLDLSQLLRLLSKCYGPSLLERW